MLGSAIQLICLGFLLLLIILVPLWFLFKDFQRPRSISPRQNFLLHLLMLGFGVLGAVVGSLLVFLLLPIISGLVQGVDPVYHAMGDVETRLQAGAVLVFTLGGLWIGRAVRKARLLRLVEEAEDKHPQKDDN